MSSFLSDSIELINQGTYGCIFKPGMNCKGGIEKKGFITKLQYDQETTQNEVDISKILLNNDNDSDHDLNLNKKKEYEKRFAPILDSCSISLGLINEKHDFIKKCNVLKENALANKFYSNRIRYVGKYTLVDYFSNLMKDFDSKKRITKYLFIRACSKFHLYLLESVLLLKEKKIIHFDLKENNILIDQKLNVPVIIDFGLSINMDPLLKKPIDSYLYTKTFFTYYDKYPPWCLEIVLVSFIVNSVSSVDSIWGGENPRIRKPKQMNENTVDWTTLSVKKEDLLLIVDHYFEENPVIKMISLNIRQEKKEKWINWIREIYTDKKTTMHSMIMVNKLIESWTTWDTFGLSVIFFMLLHKFVLVPDKLSKYQYIIIENMLAIPPERKGAEDLKKTLYDNFHSPNAIKENNIWTWNRNRNRNLGYSNV